MANSGRNRDWPLSWGGRGDGNGHRAGERMASRGDGFVPTRGENGKQGWNRAYEQGKNMKAQCEGLGKKIGFLYWGQGK